jgi:hypothetical protein
MPSIFHEYFLSDFNLSQFSIHNEQLINNEYLRTYVNNICIDDIYEKVIEMFDTHRIGIKINKDFPNDKLFTIMKPYLDLYYISNYSLNEYKKIKSYNFLHKKLHLFIKYNPNFGKRKVRLVPIKAFSKVKRVESYFDDNHIHFHEEICCNISAKSFMKSHLCKNDFYSRHMFNVRPINRISSSRIGRSAGHIGTYIISDASESDANDSEINDSDANDSDANDSEINDSDANDSDANDSDANDSDVNDSDVNESDVNESEVNETSDTDNESENNAIFAIENSDVDDESDTYETYDTDND